MDISPFEEGPVPFYTPKPGVSLNEALRRVRLAYGKTQGDMANLFGIPVSRWSQIENGGVTLHD